MSKSEMEKYGIIVYSVDPSRSTDGKAYSQEELKALVPSLREGETDE